MKSFPLKFLCLIVPAIIVSGCQKTYVVSKSQDVLFQYEYINNSGASEHRGMFIDVNGNILTYDQPSKWNSPGDDNIISQKELLENISACKATKIKIPAEELKKYTNCIDNLAATKVSLQKKSRRETGTSSYYCYQYSEASATYKRTIIKTEGDINCENLNFYSKKVVTWINDIRRKHTAELSE